MKTKIVIVGVLTALLLNLCAYAGESQASSAASTMNQSSSGNEQIFASDDENLQLSHHVD